MKKTDAMKQNALSGRQPDVIRGLFSSMPLPDLLSALNGSLSTGCLVCTVQSAPHRLYLRDSRLVYSTGPDDKLFLLQWLDGRPGITQPLLAALAAHGPAMPVLVKDLAAQRLISHHEFPEIVRHRTLNILALAFTANEGSFQFNANDLPLEPLAEIDLEIPFALMLVSQEQENAPPADAARQATDDLLELQVPTIVIPPGTDAAPGKLAAELTVVHPSGSAQSIALPEGVTLIGRDAGADIWLKDDIRASRIHARLLFGPGGVSIEDLGSANGVFVNGAQVPSAALRDGDEWMIGTHQFRLSLLPPQR